MTAVYQPENQRTYAFELCVYHSMAFAILQVFYRQNINLHFHHLLDFLRRHVRNLRDLIKGHA